MEIANVTIDKKTAARMMKAGREFDWSLSVGASVQKAHYIAKYGAKVLFNDQLFFDAAASKRLIKEYLEVQNA
jgi:hypothetical protein